jgi:hypothetical protein
MNHCASMQLALIFVALFYFSIGLLIAIKLYMGGLGLHKCLFVLFLWFVFVVKIALTGEINFPEEEK